MWAAIARSKRRTSGRDHLLKSIQTSASTSHGSAHSELKAQESSTLLCRICTVSCIVIFCLTIAAGFLFAISTIGLELFSRAPRTYPVILIPGDGGSQLEAKLNKTYGLHYFCDKVTEWFPIWINLELMVPYVLDCWVDNMRLEYDVKTRTTSPPAGVEIRVPGWGNTSTVEWLDSSQVSPTSYFAKIVTALVKDLGYVRGGNIRGAPYDFRKSPNELSQFFVDYKKLIEDTYTENGNTPVVLICHSMGCPNTRILLANQDQAWKDKHVKSIVSLGGAWSGAVKALKAFASGENLGVIVVNPLTVRLEQRTSPSLAYLAPTSRLWKKDEVLVVTPTRNYTVNDYQQFFTDMNFTTGWEMWKDAQPYVTDDRAPGVEVHCIYGRNVSTIEQIIYTKGFPDYQPNLVYGDGDGTVNMRSLQWCKTFEEKQNKPVTLKGIENVDHLAILSNIDAINYIKNVVLYQAVDNSDDTV